MKIEKLTENKIRIIINLDELPVKDLDIHNLTEKNGDASTLFESILNEAEKQVGFKVQNCKLLVEAFFTSEGYVIFTLTKYKSDFNLERSPKKLKFKRKSLISSYQNAIYKFSNFEEFCNFCTYCSNSKLGDLKDFAKNISLYEYKDLYYLIFSNISPDFKNANLFYTSIAEFSNLVSSSLIFKSKLSEYGKVIFKSNAINKGIKYFSNI